MYRYWGRGSLLWEYARHWGWGHCCGSIGGGGHCCGSMPEVVLVCQVLVEGVRQRGSLLWEYARYWGKGSLLWEYVIAVGACEHVSMCSGSSLLGLIVVVGCSL